MFNHSSWNASHGGKKFQVFSWCQEIKQDIVLWTDASHAANHLHVVRIPDVVAKNESSAGGGRHQSRENIEEGSFARAVVS